MNALSARHMGLTNRVSLCRSVIRLLEEFKRVCLLHIDDSPPKATWHRPQSCDSLPHCGTESFYSLTGFFSQLGLDIVPFLSFSERQKSNLNSITQCACCPGNHRLCGIFVYFFTVPALQLYKQ